MRNTMLLIAVLLAGCGNDNPHACTMRYVFMPPASSACPVMTPWEVVGGVDETYFNSGNKCRLLSEPATPYTTLTCDGPDGFVVSDRTCVLRKDGVTECDDYVAGRAGQDGGGACVYTAQLVIEGDCGTPHATVQVAAPAPVAAAVHCGDCNEPCCTSGVTCNTFVGCIEGLCR